MKENLSFRQSLLNYNKQPKIKTKQKSKKEHIIFVISSIRVDVVTKPMIRFMS